MRTPYYADDAVTLYHGDCREILPSLATDSASLVLTDPPYGIDKAEWDDQFPVWWMPDAARIAPVLGVMPGPWNLLRCPQSVDRLTYKWTLIAHLVNGMTRGAIGFGNYIPCVIYTSPDVTLHRTESDIARVVVGRDAKPDHPSPKPIPVMRWLLYRLCREGDTVLDPFAGSGTTLVAAKQLGLNATGIETEERYCDIIANRLAQGVLDFEVAH